MATTISPTPARSAPAGRIFNHEKYELVWGTIYVGLATNALVVVACLPLVIMLFTTNPAASWPMLAILAFLLGPALTGAFAAFRGFSETGSTTAVRTFWKAWARNFQRTATIAALLAALTTIGGINIAFLWNEQALGAALIPLQVILIVLGMVTALMALVGQLDHPQLRLLDLLRLALFVAVRRWYLSLIGLVMLGLLGTVVTELPAIGLGLAIAPLLYVTWGAARNAWRPASAEPKMSEKETQ